MFHRHLDFFFLSVVEAWCASIAHFLADLFQIRTKEEGVKKKGFKKHQAAKRILTLNGSLASSARANKTFYNKTRWRKTGKWFNTFT